jgi:hypothetical protein
MPVRFLSDAELARLSSWPNEIAADDLVTFFTLTNEDLGWLTSTVRVRTALVPRFSFARCRGWAGFRMI